MAVVFLAVLAGGAGLATATTALTGILEGNTNTNSYNGYTRGWDFTAVQNLKVTKLGYWMGMAYYNSLNNDHIITLYDSTGAVVVTGTIPAGDATARKEDGVAYVDVSGLNAQLTAGQKYTIGSYWTSSGYYDLDIQYTYNYAVATEFITLGQTDLRATGQALPTDMGNTTNAFLSPNFQFELAEPEPTNQPPLAEAGGDLIIEPDDQSTTILHGTASDPHGNPLQYRWLEGETELMAWTAVADGAAPLNLGNLSPFALGAHALTLEVTDGEATTPASMTLTVAQINEPPLADAGDNVTIQSAAKAVTAIEGAASDPDGDPLQYRWLEAGTELQAWAAVGTEGQAHLNAGALSSLALGEHVLTLEVTDSAATASDTMVLTIENTPPEAQPAPSSQAVEVYVDAIIIAAEVADFDGDTVSYEWRKDGAVLDYGTVTPPAGGTEAAIPDLALEARDPRFPVGLNTVELVVDDGVNDPVTATATVDVQDTRSPTLCPIPSRIILWPPDGQLKPVTIWANAFDRGGGPTTLSATVESSRPPQPGQTDYYIDSIDNQTDVIRLRLRAERRLPGLARVYRITVTATDAGGNSSSAHLLILAPRHGPWF